MSKVEKYLLILVLVLCGALLRATWQRDHEPKAVCDCHGICDRQFKCGLKECPK
jgi:hypothetical protein